MALTKDIDYYEETIIHKILKADLLKDKAAHEAGLAEVEDKLKKLPK